MDVARKELTGLVLIGLEMPEMSEPEFLRELRKDRRDIPAVIVIG